MFHRPLVRLLFGFLFAFFALALRLSAAQAGPPAPIDIPLTQPDGTTFTARQWGDEWQHGFETLDGYTILQAEDGLWVYAARDDAGALSPVLLDGLSLPVGPSAPPIQSRGARPRPEPRSPAQEITGGPARGQNIGSQPMLMVMVNFANRTRIYTPESFQAKGFGASNSLRDFYLDASFNNLTLVPAAETQGTANDGMVEVTLAMNHPSDTNYSEIIATAVYNAINPYVNFANFDADADGYVTSTEMHLIMIIAGYEEAYGGCTYPCIWAHQWHLPSPLTLDGKYVGTYSADGDYGGYAMFGEIHYDHAAPIGIIAHELGHDLSWPDLYDTDGSSSGVGRWSIMGSGSWNGLTYPGDSPALPDAWLKWYQGWISPTTAVKGQSYALDRANENAEALLMGVNSGGIDWDFTKHSGTGEYFLVENRQYSGYDNGLPGCGILIWHIDETRSYDNDANATDLRPLVYLEQADGLDGMLSNANRGDAGDPFPGTSANTRFNDTSYPNSRFYSGFSSLEALTINTGSCSTTMNVTYKASGVYLPVVRKLTATTSGYTGRVTYQGAGVPNQTVKMYYTTNDWSSSTLYASTLTNASGYYTFTTLPVVGSGKEYGVEWVNPDEYYTLPYQAGWVCDAVEGLPTDKLACDFDIQDVALGAPAHNAQVNLPYTFTWTRRSTATDQYEVDWWDDSLGHYLWTNKLPYANSFTLYSIPTFFYTYFPYNWTVYTYGANGYGIPYWYRWVTFLDHSSPPLTGSSPAGELFQSEGMGSIRTAPGMHPIQPRPEVEGDKPR